MENCAIYHKGLSRSMPIFIRIRNSIFEFELRKGIESISTCTRDPFIFIEECFMDTKEMVKITSGTLFDHWQVEVSVDFAHVSSISELRDTEGQNILYGDKKGVWNSLENIHAILRMDLSCYLYMRFACSRFLTGFKTVCYIRYFLKDLHGNALLNPQKGL